MVGKTRLRPSTKKRPGSTSGQASKSRSREQGSHAPVWAGFATSTLKLQSTAGNRAVQRLIQKKTEDEEQSPELFNIPGVELPPSGGGRPLPDPLQADMEESFGQSFGDVRVHEGGAASSVGAYAYTQGSDIHFAPGQYNPESESGRALVGHELTHVVQQRAGLVDSPAGSGAPVNANPLLEDEADKIGKSAARGDSVSARGTGVSGVQRSVGPVQRQPVQRQGEEELTMVGGAAVPGFGSGRTRALAAFFENGGNPAQADTQTLQQLAPAVSEVAHDPAVLEGGSESSEAIPREVHDAAAVAEEHPEAVLAEVGVVEEQSQEGGESAAPASGGVDVQAVVKETETPTSTASQSESSGGMALEQAPADAQAQAQQDLRSIMPVAEHVMQAIRELSIVREEGDDIAQNISEVQEVGQEVEEERSEERRDMALEQVGLVGAVGEGFKEVGDGGSWKVSASGVAGGTLAGVGVAATLTNTYLNIKDAVETLRNDNVDMATRVDAVGQITEALAEAGGATSSAVEIIAAWGGASKSFLEAAGNWGAVFGIVAGGVAVARGVGKGALAQHRKGKMKAIKEKRTEKGGDEDKKIAEAAEAAESTNKARVKSGAIGAAKGLVPMAAGILALSGLGPVGWGIAAAVGLGSAIYAGYKWWKSRKKSSKKKSREEAENYLRIAKLIKAGLSSQDPDIQADYVQIAISLGASKKKVKAGTIWAKELAKLLGTT